MEKVREKFKSVLLLGIISFLLPVTGGMADTISPSRGAESPIVKKAVMCENVQNGLPVNQTIIFDGSRSSAYCWSEFDPVPAESVVYHKWYRKGELITSKKLAVHPPRWAVYTRLPLRQADVGPWHLDITDESGIVITTLRFSITE
jgi:hypothetical protein